MRVERPGRLCALGSALAISLCGVVAPAAGLSGSMTASGWSSGPVGADATGDTVQKSTGSSRLLLGWRIALDPGHNGGNSADVSRTNALVSDGRGGMKPCNTVGTQSPTGYAEHAFTLDVTTRLAAALEALGAEVLLTREDDTGVGPCVDVRGRFAEDVDADLMLSVHANGSMDATVHGFFAIVASPGLSPSQGAPSAELAATMIASLSAAGFPPSTAVAGALSHRSDLATLNFARRPAVLLELGEMRHPGESALMATGEGRQRYADALTAGVLDWAGTHTTG